MQKKFFILLTFVVGFGAVAVTFFIVVFDVNRYRPELVRRLESVVGNPVHMGPLSLAWRDGLAFEIKDLAIYNAPQAVGSHALVARRVILHIRLLPLLDKKLELASVEFVGPKLRLIREANGALRIPGISSITSPRNTLPKSLRTYPISRRSPEEGYGIGSMLALESFRVEDAELVYFDKSADPPLRVVVGRLDAELRGSAVSNKVEFQGRMAVFSSQQNLSIRGRFQASGLDGHYLLKGVEIQWDLGLVQLKELLLSVPFLQNLELKEGIRGRLRARLNRFSMAKGMKPEIDISLELRDGAVGSAFLRIEGNVDIVFKEGAGRLIIQDPVVVNANILRLILKKLSAVPGVAETLDAYLPAPYRRRLAMSDTPLYPIEWSFSVKDGFLFFQDQRIAADGFEVFMSGQLSFDGNLNSRAAWALDPQLSSILISAVPNMSLLVDSYGRLVIPAKITGDIRNWKAEPDMDYILSRVLSAKGEELITGVLQKALSKKANSDLS